MAEDVFWTMPGNGVISGKAEGVDAVIGKAQTVVRYGMTFTLTHILIGQEGAVLSLHNVARRAEAVFDQDLVTVLRVENRKVCAIEHLHVRCRDGERLLHSVIGLPLGLSSLTGLSN